MPIFDSTSANDPIWLPAPGGRLDTTKLTDGTHVIRVEARTTGGVVVESDQVSVIVDNATITPPPDCESKLAQALLERDAALASLAISEATLAALNTWADQVESVVNARP